MASDNAGIKGEVRKRYAEAARQVQNQGERGSCCCSSSCCSGAQSVDLTAGAYAEEELRQLPEEAKLASLGCGNPTALADLHQGDVVLDLGSGGGIDVLLSARRVGPNGKAYGLDMTDEMLDLARENQRKSGLSNVEFLKGDIEAIPLPDNCVDVIISNCVINLAADKDQALREAFRVLKPGGRLAVMDVVIQGDRAAIPAEVLQRVESWVGCLAGALTAKEYQEKLDSAGFLKGSLQVIQEYDVNMVESMLGELDWPQEAKAVSAFIKATKPGR